MLEIYNESIRDLLTTNRTIAIESVRGDSNTTGRQYAITHDVNGNTHVSDLTIIDVCSIGQISSLLQQAAQSRFVFSFKTCFYHFPYPTYNENGFLRTMPLYSSVTTFYKSEAWSLAGLLERPT